MDEKSRADPSWVEQSMIRTAIEMAAGDKALAARLLGISQSELRKRMARYDLTAEDGPEE